MEAEQSLLPDQAKKSRGFAQKLANVGTKLGGGSSYTHKKSIEDLGAPSGYQGSMQSLHDGSVESIDPSVRRDDSVASLPRTQLGRSQLQPSVSGVESTTATTKSARRPSMTSDLRANY